MQLLERFRARFAAPAAIYGAPGRVNLIGEHTDYNDGFVLPAAIEFYCWVAAAPRRDRKLVIHSENFNETVEAGLDSLTPLGKKHWANYPLGVAWALGQKGESLTGANIYIVGEVPLGAGLSSSAEPFAEGLCPVPPRHLRKRAREELRRCISPRRLQSAGAVAAGLAS